MSDNHFTEKDHIESHQSTARRFIPRRISKIKITLPVALLGVMIAAFFIVGTGYWLYLRSDNQKYDLARPGQKDDNQALSITDDEADTTSPVDAPITKRKIEYLDKEINALKNMTDFSQDDLSDQSIQLAPAEQPSR